ncbi:hypothetical protein HYH03_011502 [Edaphochlamys debaryana]|uniref:Uncharacterized protein n=1 Tax=Edaphochlamys debaryana TaxID=47281 RepID=A0A835XRV5_9CHLO|nr:hypothetical protein HYH03_011502 [Edaphochlamys debaryana]|eukprot:KAG2490037.1 hypothetical protein HYH03_011502 [Edaphochlamys debaryana]
MTRRSLLAVSLGYYATVATAAQAESSAGEPAPAISFPVEAAPPPQPDVTVYNYDFASDVPSNLRIKEYLQIVQENRPRSWQSIAQQIQTGNFEQLTMNLNVAPMADLRQAALYLPWALLQNSEYNAATDSHKAFKNFEEHVKDLQYASASAAAALRGSPSWTPQQQAQQAQQVQQAFILMSASLDGFLSTVPAKYQGAGLAIFGRREENKESSRDRDRELREAREVKEAKPAESE